MNIHLKVMQHKNIPDMGRNSKVPLTLVPTCFRHSPHSRSLQSIRTNTSRHQNSVFPSAAGLIHKVWVPPLTDFDITLRHFFCNTVFDNLKVPQHEHLALSFLIINMSSPSLPMVPQWLEIAMGINQALGILLLV